MPKKKKDRAMIAEKHNEEPTLLLSETCVIASQAAIGKGRVYLNEGKVKPKFGTNERHDTKTWYLDSRASNHMTG